MRKLDKDKVIIFFITFIVFFINISRINEFNMIFLSTDEEAPFAIAAYFAGIDWSFNMQYVQYYSYGYSFLLYPLFLFFKEPETIYRAALVVNSIIVSCIVPMSYIVLKRHSSLNKYLLMAVSFLVALYPSNTVRANLALGECLLTLIFWVLIYLFDDIVKQNSNKKMILFTVLLFYCYTIHQRTLGVLISAIIVILIMSYNKKISKDDIMTFFSLLVVMFFAHKGIKSFLQANIWLNSPILSINDYGGQLSKIISIFTIDGFINFIKSFIGHIYYLGISTYLLGFVGVYYLIMTVIRKKDFTAGFVLLSFLGFLGISLIFMMNPIRLDNVMYGRYFEIVSGPLMAYGILNIFSEKNKTFKVIVFSSVLITMFAFILNFTLGYVKELGFAAINAIGISDYYINGEFKFLYSWILPVIIILIFFMVGKSKKIFVNILPFVLLSFVFILTRRNVINNTVLPFSNMNYLYKNPISKIDDDVENIYYVGYRHSVDGSYIQYLLFDKPLINLDPKQTDFIEGNHYLISEFLNEDILKNYNYEDFINGLFFLTPKKNNSESGFVISGGKFTFSPKSKEDGYIVSDSDILYGQKLSIEEGTYEFEIDMELIKNEAGHLQIGQIIVESDEPKKEYYTIILNKDDFINDKLNLTIPLDIKEKAYNTSFITYANNGVELKINNVIIK